VLVAGGVHACARLTQDDVCIVFGCTRQFNKFVREGAYAALTSMLEVC
jgi:hypothetical protein